MNVESTALKSEDRCFRCGGGQLTVSPSGRHLMCRSCGYIVIHQRRETKGETQAKKRTNGGRLRRNETKPEPG